MFVMVPQPKVNVLVRACAGGRYLEINYANEMFPEMIELVIKEFGKTRIDYSDNEVTLFVNPVYNYREIVSFIEELFND